MILAITRPVSASLPECALTHRAREPIDVARARVQHAAYRSILASLGATLLDLPEAPELPDAVFVEDTAVVLPEVAVITRPGSPSRRPETVAVAALLKEHRPLLHIDAPDTLDGGDVLRIGRRLYVGRSSRTTAEGIEQLRRHLAPFDYEVVGVGFSDCLHLKSAVTEVADRVLLVNPAWVRSDAFPGCRAIPVDPSEPDGANALRFGGRVVYPAQFTRTAVRLEREGLIVAPVPSDELAKAEGGVTCCSLILGDSV
jgi:dimethylargininase